MIPEILCQYRQYRKTRELLPTGFQKSLLTGALMNFEERWNPLRLNNFSFVLRELIDNVLCHLAPDDDVKDCPWYSRPNGDRDVIRAQRLHYAAAAGLEQDFVEKTLSVPLGRHIKETNSLIRRLNAYTHVTQSTYSASATTASVLFEESMGTLNQIISAIVAIHTSVENTLAGPVTFEILTTMLEQTFQELDELSTHSTVEDVFVDSIEVEELTAKRMALLGAGTVTCRLQYGSDADVDRDIGFAETGELPFEFTAAAKCENPLALEVDPGEIRIDTSGFFE